MYWEDHDIAHLHNHSRADQPSRIFTGLIVLSGMLAGKRLDGWTKWFLITAVATTVTGFFFPFHGFTPAIGLGLISLPVLALTIFARYSRQPWTLALDLCGRRFPCSLFQCLCGNRAVFEKIPALKAVAPTQSEPPFKLTQLVVLALFVVLAFVAAIRFRPQPVRVR
jgi:hypothetical protein